MINNTLGTLESPTNCHEPICISGVAESQLKHYLESMLHIRKAEQKLAEKKRDGFIGGPVHLGVGQEAIAVGVSASLRKTDYVFGAHRSHSHLLALGSSLHGLFAEVLGKDTGHSRGMGGSMHLWDESCGFYGSVPIMAGTVPLAVGAGLSAKLKGSDSIAVAYLGDGAVEEGIVNESLNLAKILNAPVLFVVENNLFASHMHISLRQPLSATSRFAEANAIPSIILDGNDVVSVAKTAAEKISQIRSGGGPAFLELVTYRWYGHVDWREDIDVGVHRSNADLENWRARDPIKRLVESMIKQSLCTQEEIYALEARLDREVETTWGQAMEDPYPKNEALLDRVYSN